MDRFYPAIFRVKEIVDSGELGTLTKIEANIVVPSGFIKDNDNRMVYELGGGCTMDMGSEFDSTVQSFALVSHDGPDRLHFVHITVLIRRGSYEGDQCKGRNTSQVPSDRYSRHRHACVSHPGRKYRACRWAYRNAQYAFPASPAVWLHSAVAEVLRAC